MKDEKFKLLMFTIYVISFELLVFPSFMYVVFILNYSPWYLTLMIALCCSWIRPKYFGLDYKIT